MVKRSLLLLILFLGVAGGADAQQCTFEVQARYEGRDVVLTLPPDVGRAFSVSESTDFEPDFYYPVTALSHDSRRPTEWRLERISTDTHTFHYQVVARRRVNGVEQLCIATTQVVVTADPEMRRLLRRSIIPIVGSARGANGSNFKTAVKLQFVGESRGRIIFRPVGTLPSDADPSIRWDAATTRTLEFDDIVAAMGASGLGSLEFVPDEDAEPYTPRVEVRLYNDTGNGTFGTKAEAIFPADVLGEFRGASVPAAPAGFRRMIGLRTFTQVDYRVVITHASGSQEMTEIRRLPAEITLFMTPEAFAGRPVPETSRVSMMLLGGGQGIGFYSLTDNRTNDPELFILERGRSPFVGRYIFPRESDFLRRQGF